MRQNGVEYFEYFSVLNVRLGYRLCEKSASRKSTWTRESSFVFQCVFMTNDSALMRDFRARYHHQIVFTQPGSTAAKIGIIIPLRLVSAMGRWVQVIDATFYSLVKRRSVQYEKKNSNHLYGGPESLNVGALAKRWLSQYDSQTFWHKPCGYFPRCLRKRWRASSTKKAVKRSLRNRPLNQVISSL